LPTPPHTRLVLHFHPTPTHTPPADGHSLYRSAETCIHIYDYPVYRSKSHGELRHLELAGSFGCCFFIFLFFSPFVAFLSASLFRRQPHLPRQTTRISPRRSLAPPFIMCMAPRFRVRRLLGLFHVYRSCLYTRHRSC
jgi:hypothetical protein